MVCGLRAPPPRKLHGQGHKPVHAETSWGAPGTASLGLESKSGQDKGLGIWPWAVKYQPG